MMKYDLKKPCKGCPFKKSCAKGWLGKGRAKQIINSIIVNQETFSCHNTNELGEEGEMIETKDTQHCAGAMILLERLEKPNQMMRIAERLGMYDYKKLDMNSDVFEDYTIFIEHHSNNKT